MLIRLTLLIPGTPPEYWDADDIALEMSDHPDIWTYGSRERCRAFLPVPGCHADCSAC